MLGAGLGWIALSLHAQHERDDLERMRYASVRQVRFEGAPGGQGTTSDLRVSVALNRLQRRRGLMNRLFLGPDRGMLFVFMRPRKVCFWMHNTILPLSLAFVDVKGRMSSIVDMAPMTDALHCAPGAVRYGVEANKGWFASHGVHVGDMVRPLS